MMGSPEQGQVIKVLAVRRFVPHRILSELDCLWLVCTGMHMGRWTLHFGIHCLADDHDNKQFARLTCEEHSGSELLEMEVHCTMEPSLMGSCED